MIRIVGGWIWKYLLLWREALPLVEIYEKKIQMGSLPGSLILIIYIGSVIVLSIGHDYLNKTGGSYGWRRLTVGACMLLADISLLLAGIFPLMVLLGGFVVLLVLSVILGLVYMTICIGFKFFLIPIGLLAAGIHQWRKKRETSAKTVV